MKVSGKQAEELLRELSSAVEQTADSVIICDQDGVITDVNPAFEKHSGYTKEEAVGKTPRILKSGKHDQSFYEKLWKTILSGKVFRDVFINRKKNGVLYFEDRTISPLKNSHGDITAFVSVGRSLIRRKREEEQYQAFVEGSASAFVVITGEGRIVLVNRETERMFGYARQELLGKPLEILLPERFREVHTKHRARYLLDLFPRPMGTGLDLYARRKDGSEFPVEISLGPIETDEGLLITSIVTDITARKQAEEKIRASLKQNEVLLQEIHHRVKNNLQIISSLLSLQSARIRDKQAREMFTTCQSRVRSIALLHEKLYQSKDLSRIDFAEYSRSLAANLLGSYGIDSEDIALKVSVEEGFLGLDAAIPCGLIVNELVSNSLKHAFPAGKRGEISIDLRQDKQNKYMLTVRDNGVGFPKDVDFRKTETLGLQLVCTLTDQLGGTIELRRAEGTEFRIGFDSGVP